MRKIFSILFFVLPFYINAQNTSFIEQKDWDSIIVYLGNEGWVNADRLISASLKKCPEDQQESDITGMLRYMSIFCKAGLMNEQKISKENALENVKSFIGHSIILPGVTVSLKNGFNIVQLKNNNTDTLFITASNAKATQLFAFTYIIPANPISLDDYTKAVDKTALIKGNLQDISVEGISLPRFRIYINKAEMFVD